MQVWVGHDVAVLAVTIGAENLTSGIGSAAFVAYLSGLCDVASTATQYALLSSLATVGVNICRHRAAGSPTGSAGSILPRQPRLALPGLVLLLLADARPVASDAAGITRRSRSVPDEDRIQLDSP